MIDLHDLTGSSCLRGWSRVPVDYRGGTEDRVRLRCCIMGVLRLTSDLMDTPHFWDIPLLGSWAGTVIYVSLVEGA